MNSPAATRDSNAKDYLAHVLCGYRHPKKVVVWVHEQAFLRKRDIPNRNLNRRRSR
jgi:hypothetical protein